MLKKSELLFYYREGIKETITEVNKKTKNSEKSNLINKQMKNLLSSQLTMLGSEDINDILLIHYTYYIVMLESRNQVWNYDYMAFSRRIGELWEPFCKLPFQYSINPINFYEPPKYEEFKSNLQIDLLEFIEGLSLNSSDKKNLINYIDDIWAFSESGAINLKEDLHFYIGDKYYVVDYKSGFSSNEKGNVNRLLQVAKLYTTIDYECMLFVRQREEENNHYLQTLKNSGLWNVYCSSDTYSKILEITGVDLRAWMDKNMDWANDISPEFKKYLIQNQLLQYLTW
ncbi:hypothetical protein J7S27_04400 [Carnobacteriaceae bacterium zg-C25]|nr:hypothetical protein J7S27_04400 [Carnobacteriaceae bacterium zg-C25]